MSMTDKETWDFIEKEVYRYCGIIHSLNTLLATDIMGTAGLDMIEERRRSYRILFSLMAVAKNDIAWQDRLFDTFD